MQDRDALFDIGHPAPHRESINMWLLMFGLFGSALAWSLQLNTGAALGGLLCASGDGPDGKNFAGAHVLLVAINGLALAISMASLWASYRTLVHTGHMHEGNTGDLLDAGEGRTRFLAMWAVFTSLLFTIAVAFNTLTALWGSICS
ncbi:MAG: hypothetical protein K2Q28_14190 [Hyphomicrobium sp.]|nr:hypothetical protein [Hyphomicrobium sp.]